MRVFRLRIALCERFTGWAIAICPKGYSPSYVEAVLIAYRNGLKGLGIGGEPIAPSAEEDAA